jgi:hypothetical protein
VEIENLERQEALKLLGTITLMDGYLQINDENCRWELETSPNLNLHKICEKLFLKAFEIQPKTYHTKNNKYTRTCVSGRKYEKHLIKIKDLTKNNFEFLKNETKNLKILAFRLGMDLEGSINVKFSIKKKNYKKNKYFQFQFEPELKLSFVNHSKINDWINIVDDIGFVFTKQTDNRYNDKLGGLRTSNRVHIINFYEEMGGFLTDLKIKKSSAKSKTSNNGFSKQCVLKTVTFILKNYSNLCSKSFRDKDEAEKYRKWFIKEIYVTTREKFK